MATLESIAVSLETALAAHAAALATVVADVIDLEDLGVVEHGAAPAAPNSAWLRDKLIRPDAQPESTLAAVVALINETTAELATIHARLPLSVVTRLGTLAGTLSLAAADYGVDNTPPAATGTLAAGPSPALPGWAVTNTDPE